MDVAWAVDEPVFTPIAWKSYPNNDSVEMGDHSLNLNFSFGGPNDVVSSAAHNTRFGSRGTPSGFTVLLRTSSDGTTRKLPPTNAVSSRLNRQSLLLAVASWAHRPSVLENLTTGGASRLVPSSVVTRW